jgi:proteasome accessory factor B
VVSTDSAGAASVAVEERLFSLVLALLASEAGLTKNEILSTVQGYRQKYAFAGDNASLERQFERDKDDIRELGVPLETIEPLDEPGSNHNLRYRIPKGAYDLPADISRPTRSRCSTWPRWPGARARCRASHDMPC